MGNQIKITADNLNNIAAKLDAAGATLSVEEKGLLASVFQAAAVQIHGDVQGFAAIGVGAGAATPNLGGAFGAVFGLAGGAIGTATGVAAGAGGGVGVSAAGAGAGVGAGGGGVGAGISVPGVGGASTYVVL